jgi:hypothetical protein
MKRTASNVAKAQEIAYLMKSIYQIRIVIDVQNIQIFT